MLNRYSAQKDGKQRKVAAVYTAEEHGINKKLIDRDALAIISRLARHGFDAFIVGGAVRDLMIGITPKDFDIVTNAHPRQIRKIFRNSRIIGRRFRLVHVFFGENIFEVATFRSNDSEDNNAFGTIEEDVRRRDFTANALYYDPDKEYVLDYVDGVSDIKKKTLKALIPLKDIFIDDPVRMIRAVKYAGTTDFSLERKLKAQIKKDGAILAECSRSRMTEEVFKILQSGKSEKVIAAMEDFELFVHMLPEIAQRISLKNPVPKSFYDSLSMLDQLIAGQPAVDRAVIIKTITEPFISFPPVESTPEEAFTYLFKEIKDILAPITPPNTDVEKTVIAVCEERGITCRKKKKRRPHPRLKTEKGKPHKTVSKTR